ncbi:MAG: tRNA (adenosine(37)-N6)-dimethylallyltransferase MiaA, partial [Muribaculaceae bacterium]|nr:tRNA (adenosine(37)-N6)-dimethylallyltransferase MiaA [Muribaculaceae bacterium]
MCDSLPILAVVGPTASGKTRRAVEFAKALEGEIISGDSRQVYRGMDIGTGKDLAEYGRVPYHLIDVAPAGAKYNLFEYLRDAAAALSVISAKGKVPVLCGGSGLYVESFLKGMELPAVPENPVLRERLEGKSLEELTEILAGMKTLHNVTDVDTAKRAVRAIEIQTYYAMHPETASLVAPATPRNALIVGIDIDRDARRERISQRLDARIEEGLVDEVRGLIDGGVSPDDLMYYGLEYKFVTLHVTGELGFDAMRAQLETAIHQFAKRQMTWFRGMERRGFHIDWLDYDMDSES